MFNLHQYTNDILDELKRLGVLDESGVQNAIRLIDAEAYAIDDAILSLGCIEQPKLMKVVAETTGLQLFDDLTDPIISIKYVEKFGTSFWEARDMVPLQEGNGLISILTSKPGELAKFEEVAFLLGLQPELVLGSSSAVRRALREGSFETKRNEQQVQQRTSIVSITPNVTRDEDGKVAKAIDALVSEGLSLNATDIHLDAVSDDLFARLRVEGLLQPVLVSSDISGAELLSRLKLLAGLSVTEKRLPQNGGCRINHGGRVVELRVSTLPIEGGETMVCRLLDPNVSRSGWAELGFPDGIATDFRTLVERPHGLLIISGPTGAGKTTTLYTALRHLNDGTKKIISAEDPVEQSIEGIQQVQINSAVGLTFAEVLKTMLRHDPDVIMIGEIRDEETAQIACRAALIGRLVLATVHASSTSMVRERLINLTVPAFLVDEVLIGVLSQKLIPAICGNCNGSGCYDCVDRGKKGRVPKVELWEKCE